MPCSIPTESVTASPVPSKPVAMNRGFQGRAGGILLDPTAATPGLRFHRIVRTGVAAVAPAAARSRGSRQRPSRPRNQQLLPPWLIRPFRRHRKQIRRFPTRRHSPAPADPTAPAASSPLPVPLPPPPALLLPALPPEPSRLEGTLYSGTSESSRQQGATRTRSECDSRSTRTSKRSMVRRIK